MAHAKTTDRPAFPRPIRKALTQVDRRLKGLAALNGLGTSGLVAALGAVAGMAADFAWGLPQAARWATWGAWVVAAAVPTAAALGRLLSRRSNDLALAAVLEKADPTLGERLTGAVDLLEGRAHGSPRLIAALADDAAARVAAVDPAVAASSEKARRRFALGFAAVCLVAAPAVPSGEAYGRLARRFLAPWAESERVGLFDVSAAPGDAVVALGADFRVTARVVPRFELGSPAAPGSVWVEWTDVNTGRIRRIVMAEETAEAKAGPRLASQRADPNGNARAFAAVLPRLTGSLAYRVVSRSGESPRYRVTAVEPPTVETVAVRVEPPAYTKRPPFDVRDPSRIEAFEGSLIRFTVTTSAFPSEMSINTWPVGTERTADAKPWRSGYAASQYGPGNRAVLSSDGMASNFALTRFHEFSYEIRFREFRGIWNRPEPPRRLIVQRDKPPTLTVRGPSGAEAEEARGDDTLRVALTAYDDIAVDSVQLHYKVERANGMSTGGTSSQDAGHIDARVRGLGTASATGEAALGLKSLGLRPGDVVTWRVRAADNRPFPGGPNVVWSAERRLAIVAKADPLSTRRGEAEKKALQAELDALKKGVAENRQATELLRYAADAARNGNGTFTPDKVQELARREAAARGAVDGLREFARRLDNTPAFRPLARPARQAADVEAEAARATLDQARQDDDPAKRFAGLRLADARLNAVSLRLDELQRDLNTLAEREAEVRRLQALADRQAEVAAHAGGNENAPDRPQLDRIAAEQNAVRNELDALLKKSPDLRADVLAAEAEKAAALAQRARGLAERQRREARRATDLTDKAAALRALADEQRAVEEDARRLALDVDAPLAESGRGRLNVEPIRQAVGPLERGELAPARDRLAGAEAELRRLARDLEETPGDLKALASRLARRQDQIVNDLARALGDVRRANDLLADERAAVDRRLALIVARQKAVAGLVATVLKSHEAKNGDVEPKFPREAAEQAAAAATRAADAAARAADNPREAEARAGEARAALHRLAGELPDAWRREAPSRQAFAQARQDADAVANEVDRHLRETDRPHDKGFTPARAAADLAQRLGPLAGRAAKAADVLASAPPVPRARPQTDRAARRARALADAIEATRAWGERVPNAPPSPELDAPRARAVRDALAAAASESRLGFERLEQRLNGQAPADDVADELLAELRAPADPDPAARAEGQRRLAAALRGLRAPDAPLEQSEAVRYADLAADALARRATKPDQTNTADEAGRRAVAAVEALADRLNDRLSPRDHVRMLARVERAETAPGEEAGRHRAVAAALARLQVAKIEGEAAAADKAAEAVREATALAERANAPDKPTPEERSAARVRAAEALDVLATRLGPGEDEPARDRVGNPPPRDPDLAIDAGHAARAQDLARRERRLREKVLAVLADRVRPQDDLRREAEGVGRDLAELRDRTRELSPRASGPAHEAAALLGEQAPQAMGDAAGQLAQGQTDPAREAQRRAAELAERGAQRVDDLAAALRAERPADADTKAPAEPDAGAKHRPDPRALTDARDAMSRAARSLEQARPQGSEPGHNPSPPLAGARKAMRDAADRLQEAAEAARSRQGDGEPQPGESGPSLARSQKSPAPGPRDPKGGKAGVADPESLGEIQDLVRSKTGRKWGELPGHLRTEILQMSQGRYRDDYARLIQLYYREIAAGAAGREVENPGERP